MQLEGVCSSRRHVARVVDQGGRRKRNRAREICEGRLSEVRRRRSGSLRKFGADREGFLTRTEFFPPSFCRRAGERWAVVPNLQIVAKPSPFRSTSVLLFLLSLRSDDSPTVTVPAHEEEIALVSSDRPDSPALSLDPSLSFFRATLSPSRPSRASFPPLALVAHSFQRVLSSPLADQARVVSRVALAS